MLPFARAEDPAGWLVPLLVHLLLIAGALWVLARFRRLRFFGFCVLGLYVSLAPLSCLMPELRLARFSVDIDFPVSERFLYIPSLFLVFGVGWLLVMLPPSAGGEPGERSRPRCSGRRRGADPGHRATAIATGRRTWPYLPPRSGLPPTASACA